MMTSDSDLLFGPPCICEYAVFVQYSYFNLRANSACWHVVALEFAVPANSAYTRL